MYSQHPIQCKEVKWETAHQLGGTLKMASSAFRSQS